MSGKRSVIDPSTVLNGTIWQERWPLCTELMVLYVRDDQWMLVMTPVPAHQRTDGSVMLVMHDKDGRYLRSHAEVVEYLESMGAFLLDAAMRVDRRTPTFY